MSNKRYIFRILSLNYIFFHHGKLSTKEKKKKKKFWNTLYRLDQMFFWLIQYIFKLKIHSKQYFFHIYIGENIACIYTTRELVELLDWARSSLGVGRKTSWSCGVSQLKLKHASFLFLGRQSQRPLLFKIMLLETVLEVNLTHSWPPLKIYVFRCLQGTLS